MARTSTPQRPFGALLTAMVTPMTPAGDVDLEAGVALGEDQFLAWQEADQLNAQRDAERAGRAGPPKLEGTVKWLVQAYMRSSKFTEKAPKTRHAYERYAAWLTDAYGDLSCAGLSVPTCSS